MADKDLGAGRDARQVERCECSVHKGVVYDREQGCPKCFIYGRFQKHPEEFVHVSELALAVKLEGSSRYAVLVNSNVPPNVLYAAKGLLERAVHKRMDAIDAAAAPLIHTPEGKGIVKG